MDELLHLLCKSIVGCFIGHHYSGALCYADDLTLIAPSLSATKYMLAICEQFAREYDVLFNSTKSISLLYNDHLVKDCSDLCLHGEVIPRCANALHLGLQIGRNSQEMNVNKAKRDICIRVNSFMSNFEYCNFDVLCRLFTTYCTSYYGSPVFEY